MKNLLCESRLGKGKAALILLNPISKIIHLQSGRKFGPFTATDLWLVAVMNRTMFVQAVEQWATSLLPLAESLREKGQVSPVVVAEVQPDYFSMTAGVCRLLASTYNHFKHNKSPHLLAQLENIH